MWVGKARVYTVGLAVVSVLGIFLAGCSFPEVGKGESQKETKEEVPTGAKEETPTGTSKPSNGGEVENGKIAFVSNRYHDGYYDKDVYVMNADGSEQTDLSNNTDGEDSGLVWSPDGHKIAFTSVRDHNYEVYVMNADGSNQTNLSNDSKHSDWGPSWSPDGTRAAFTSERDGNSEIYTVGADGAGTPTNLSKNPGDDEKPLWSPDGTKIAFERNHDIFVVNADGTGTPANLSNGSSGSEPEPSWSPDSTRIAFKGYRDNAYGEIYTVDADSSNLTRLTNNSAFDSGPAFSPDGTKIAFTSERDGVSQVYVMNAGGSSNQTNLSNDPESEEWGPVWSPDGTKIAFVRRDSRYREIYTMDADGSKKTALTYSSDNNEDPRWQPIGGTPTDTTGSKAKQSQTKQQTSTDICAPKTGQSQSEQSQGISITSEDGWQQTPLSLQKGDRFEVRYSKEKWTVDCRNFPYVGPEGYPPDIDEQIYQGCRLVDSLPYGTLLGKVGNGSTFAVGKGGEFTADASGALSLRINDDDACLGDNDGELVVNQPEPVGQSD